MGEVYLELAFGLWSEQHLSVNFLKHCMITCALSRPVHEASFRQHKQTQHTNEQVGKQIPLALLRNNKSRDVVNYIAHFGDFFC